MKRDENTRQGRRVTSSVDIDPGERKAINDFAGRYGGKGTQKRVLTLLIQWFAGQPESVKQSVLGWAAADMREQYATVLDKLAKDMRQEPAVGTEGYPIGSTGLSPSQPHAPAKPSTPPEEPPTHEQQGRRRGRSR